MLLAQQVLIVKQVQAEMALLQVSQGQALLMLVAAVAVVTQELMLQVELGAVAVEKLVQVLLQELLEL
jgi:hypothetical protein